MKKWEYKSISEIHATVSKEFNTTPIEMQLNEMGEQGWELIAINVYSFLEQTPTGMQNRMTTRYTFKKEIENGLEGQVQTEEATGSDTPQAVNN